MKYLTYIRKDRQKTRPLVITKQGSTFPHPAGGGGSARVELSIFLANPNSKILFKSLSFLTRFYSYFAIKHLIYK